jgi:hypothetical protein
VDIVKCWNLFIFSLEQLIVFDFFFFLKKSPLKSHADHIINRNLARELGSQIEGGFDSGLE